MRDDEPVTVVVDVAAGDAELVADTLWSLGATAIGEECVGDGLRLTSAFPDDGSAREAAAVVGGRVVGVGPSPVSVREGVVAVGRLRILVIADGTLSPGADVEVDVDVDVVLAPGTTFGDAHHPSTRLALLALEDLVRPGTSVLDVGCGSGILAVAAAVLGATAVTAVDVDADAVRTTRENAARNRAPVAASTTPVADVDGSFDVVVANLGGTRVVHELGPALVARTAGRGRLVVSGLLADRLPPPSVATPGLVVEQVREEDGWAAMILRRGGC